MLWEEVKNTKIHLVYDDDAEFSLYVYVEPYSHNVLSVWFYLLALTKDRHRGNVVTGGGALGRGGGPMGAAAGMSLGGMGDMGMSLGGMGMGF